MSRRVQARFLLALAGVLVLFGVLAAQLGGPVALAVYAVVVLALLVAGVARARPVAPPASGRTCSCCTTTVHDPVQVR